MNYILKSKFVKFLVVGGINTVFGYSLFALFIYFNFHYAIATLCATVIGIFFNFKTIGSIVFKSKNNNLLFRFFIVYGFVYLLNILLMFLLNSLVNDNHYVSGAMTVFPLAILSFLLNKKYVFN
ncbi:GtrA family protein [Paenibacillus sp. Soil750]|uniref:GtrA family protein n=1 Tax=Paenibacillus sp. Soil750 TaxID=1736398 RepID=UPI0006F98BD5|nr:GtrA family protein [Paenibacillus sp. Soil750]KRE75861.1 polysaccharide biosynthesis protein GtrA [Paenibacillus sp. Soil750]